MIAILNLVEITMIVKIKRKKKLCEILLLSLSVSDFMFGISNVFVDIFFLAGACGNKHFVEAAFTTCLFFVLTSIFHLFFITLDWLIAILKPLQHKLILSRKRVYIFLILLWILSVAISASLQIANEFTDTFKRDTLKARFQNQTFMMTPFLKLERKKRHPTNCDTTNFSETDEKRHKLFRGYTVCLVDNNCRCSNSYVLLPNNLFKNF